MKLNPRKSTGSKGPNSRQSESRSASKFLPNLSQLQQVVKELPDPEGWSEDTYVHKLIVDKRRKSLEFVRKRITRGDKRPYRWIYEGKVLIRNRDV